MTHTERICRVCLGEFIPKRIDQITCCDQCRWDYKRRADRERMRAKKAGTPPPPKPPRKPPVEFACERCRHAIKSKLSETGWECRVFASLSCKPHTPAAFARVVDRGSGI